jgi:hypothetical protein
MIRPCQVNLSPICIHNCIMNHDSSFHQLVWGENFTLIFVASNFWLAPGENMVDSQAIIDGQFELIARCHKIYRTGFDQELLDMICHL